MVEPECHDYLDALVGRSLESIGLGAGEHISQAKIISTLHLDAQLLGATELIAQASLDAVIQFLVNVHVVVSITMFCST